jgi:hypothetical protein
MVTLSKEPPTLDRESTKHKYTKTFKEMIDSCLHKDPTKRCSYFNKTCLVFFYIDVLSLTLIFIFVSRPSAEKLLTHHFFKVSRRKDYLVSRILQHLPPLEERPHKSMHFLF